MNKPKIVEKTDSDIVEVKRDIWRRPALIKCAVGVYVLGVLTPIGMYVSITAGAQTASATPSTTSVTALAATQATTSTTATAAPKR